jgi:H+/Cl- antiporter ClcA
MTAAGRRVLRAVGLGVGAGVLAGLSSWLFLRLLDKAIEFREDRASWLLWLLGPAGFAIVAAFHHLGGRTREGTRLVIAGARATDAGPIPARMTPLIMLGSAAAHLFGASVGREGVAVQMSGSLAETAARPLRLDEVGRRDLLLVAIAGGFGAMFGTPFAGVVFTLEVGWRERRPVAFVAAAAGSLVAALTGNLVVESLGYHHIEWPEFELAPGPWMLVRFAIAGLAFGATAWLFRASMSGVKRVLGRIGYPPMRAAVAGCAIALATIPLGRESLSLSNALAVDALAGNEVGVGAWLSKLAFTAVSLGSGIPGGDVAPLFVTGAALGAALAKPLSIAQPALAAVGFVSVLGAAARTPLMTIVLAAELFGPRALIPTTIVALAALLPRGHGGLYEPDPRR